MQSTSAAQRFCSYSSSNILDILRHHVIKNNSRLELPMCTKPGKHGRLQVQQILHAYVMKMNSFAYLSAASQPSCEAFNERVDGLVVQAKSAHNALRPPEAAEPSGTKNLRGKFVNGFNVVRDAESLSRDGALSYLLPIIKLKITKAQWDDECRQYNIINKGLKEAYVREKTLEIIQLSLDVAHVLY